jgi:amino-acid N-acetyltransferase
MILRKAVPSDAKLIHDMLVPYANEGIILRRPLPEIEMSIPNFFVAEEDGQIVGTVAFYSYGEHLKEIRSLAVSPSAKGKGIGRGLVEYAVAAIRGESPAAKIFTLTWIPDFFVKLNFHPVEMSTLPEKIRKDCSICTKQDTCGETALVYSRR